MFIEISKMFIGIRHSNISLICHCERSVAISYD